MLKDVFSLCAQQMLHVSTFNLWHPFDICLREFHTSYKLRHTLKLHTTAELSHEPEHRYSQFGEKQHVSTLCV